MIVLLLAIVLVTASATAHGQATEPAKPQDLAPLQRPSRPMIEVAFGGWWCACCWRRGLGDRAEPQRAGTTRDRGVGGGLAWMRVPANGAEARTSDRSAND